MDFNRQLEEAFSWRLITELWRRYPKKFNLIEAHPGGGQSDCLALITKGRDVKFAIDVNRGGSVHIYKDAFDLGSEMLMHSDWLEKMLGSYPKSFLDLICDDIRFNIPKQPPISTPETIIYRFISDFLASSVGKIENWRCLSGFCDTSGYGGGERRTFFKCFSKIKDRELKIKLKPVLGIDSYNYWFLVKNGKPVLALCKDGYAINLKNKEFNLFELYKKHKRIWPLINKVIGDLLP